MKRKRRVIIYIPAKKNSKRLPNKNFRKLNGKKLYEYSVDFALNLKKLLKKAGFSSIIILDTDNKSVEERKGVILYERREAIAKKDVPIAYCFNDCCERMQLDEEHKYNDVVVILQPTTPMRILGNVLQAIYDVNVKQPFLTSVIPVKNPILANGDIIQKGIARMETGSFFVFLYGLRHFILSFSGFKIVAKPFIDFAPLQDIDTKEEFLKVKEEIKKWKES